MCACVYDCLWHAQQNMFLLYSAIHSLGSYLCKAGDGCSAMQVPCVGEEFPHASEIYVMSGTFPLILSIAYRFLVRLLAVHHQICGVGPLLL